MFSDVLPPEWLAAFEQDRSIVYSVNSLLRLTRTNVGWDSFAVENGAPFLAGNHAHGTFLMDVIPPSLQAFYEELYHRVARRGQEQSHVFECSSPTTFRKYHSRLLPLAGNGVLTINSLIAENVMQSVPKIDELYVDAEGIVAICSHCRRVKNLAVTNRWDWAPSYWSDNSHKLSHGLCPVCVAYHYPLGSSS